MSSDTPPESTDPKHEPWSENPSQEWIYALEHLNAGQHELALKHCRRAIDIWPDYYNAWMLLATVLEQQDELDEALDAIQRASEIAIEELGYAWNTQAFLHIARGEYADALTVDRVLDLVDPTRHGIVRYRMAIAQTQMGNPDEALEFLEEAFKYRPDLKERVANEPLLDPIRDKIESLSQ